MEWSSLGKEEALSKLSSSREGLSQKGAEERLKKYGINMLRKRGGVNPISIFLNQFKSFLVLILLVAISISYLSGETFDALMILLIVVLNAVLGFVQEYRAEKAIEALKSMVTPMALAVRDGREVEIEASKLVPGDIILLSSGDKVPADARLIETAEFWVDESILTGESSPLPKKPELSDKAGSIVFMGTSVVRGKCRAVVFSTGMSTELGKIADMVQEEKEGETPLQRRLDEFGKNLGIGAIVLCAVIFVVGIVNSQGSLNEMFTTAVSLAVAAMPSSLPAVVTITLALGVQQMAKRNSIVRKLSSVESLGSATFICTDKTGTITKNEMTVRKIYAEGKFVDVSGEGYEPKGNFSRQGKPFDAKAFEKLFQSFALCNSASLYEEGDFWKITGDPTEGALLVLAAKAGFELKELKASYPQVDEIPFESERKMMTTVHKGPEGRMSFTKGAAEIILQKSTHMVMDGKIVKIGVDDKRKILAASREMAQKALRVLAAAYRPSVHPDETPESGLVFLGLAGMIDPPRQEVKKAIGICNSAGISVIMITGDSEMTAEAVGREVGLLDDRRLVMTGDHLSRLSDDQLAEKVRKIGIFARVRPEHKVRIVKALRANGEVVAMTGDGVNDAPALKAADVGIAMGITGTDVSKEASDMILTDDNFATIVSAVEQGRTIYTNIKKSIRYLISCNLGELGTVFGAVILNLGVPLVPVQILWMNFVTDGLPALALGMEKPEQNIMARKPKDPKESILSRQNIMDMFGVGLIMTAGALLVFWIEMAMTGDITRARTVTFTVLVVFQLVNALSCRSELKSLLSADLLSNRAMILAVFSSLALQLAVVYLPPLQPIFKTVGLDLMDWGMVFLLAILPFFGLELAKNKLGLEH